MGGRQIADLIVSTQASIALLSEATEATTAVAVELVRRRRESVAKQAGQASDPVMPSRLSATDRDHPTGTATLSQSSRAAS